MFAENYIITVPLLLTDNNCAVAYLLNVFTITSFCIYLMLHKLSGISGKGWTIGHVSNKMGNYLAVSLRVPCRHRIRYNH